MAHGQTGCYIGRERGLRGKGRGWRLGERREEEPVPVSRSVSSPDAVQLRTTVRFLLDVFTTRKSEMRTGASLSLVPLSGDACAVLVLWLGLMTTKPAETDRSTKRFRRNPGPVQNGIYRIKLN